MALSGLRSALATTLAASSRNERDLLWLRHAAGLTIARIALDRGIHAKVLYRRYEQIYSSMRVKLEALGVSSAS
ncbi:MAG: hypothetical protein ABIQ52_21190, partial [Vicinamibacterales bacterium]